MSDSYDHRPSLHVLLKPRGLQTTAEQSWLTRPQVMLCCTNLREAEKRSTALQNDNRQEGRIPILRVHATRVEQAFSDNGRTPSRLIEVLPTARSIASLLVDATLLGIAYGALISFEEVTEADSVAQDLAANILARGGAVAEIGLVPPPCHFAT